MPVVLLGALTFATGYAVLNGGGGDPEKWNLSLLILGLAGIVCASRADARGVTDRLALWAAVLLPAFVAFQLVPLPPGVLQILSPARGELADALGAVLPPVHFAPLTIGPPKTWHHLSRIVGYALIFLMVRRLARQRPWTAAIPLILIGGAEAAWGLMRASAAEAVSGTFFNHAQFSGLLEMILPFALVGGVGLLGSRFAAALGLMGLAAVIFIAIVSSLSKMGFISTLGSLLVMGVLLVASRVPGWKKWPALAGLAVLLLGVFLAVAPNELVDAFGTTTSDPSGEGRMPIWGDTLKIIAAYPLFGSGLATYFPALLRFQTSGLHFAWVNAHNDYLELLAELGVLGFGIAAALMGLVFYRAARAAVSRSGWETRLLGLACVGGIAAALIHSLADFNTYVPADAMVLAWVAGMAAGLEPLPHGRGSERKVLMAGSGLAVVYSAAWLIFLGFGFNVDAKAEPVFCRFGICDTYGLESTRLLLHKAKAIDKLPPSDVEEFLRRDPAGPYRWEDLGDSFQNAGRTGYARYCYRKADALGPNIPYMLSRAANFHFDLGENREALALLSRAMQADPQYQGTAFSAYAQRKIGLEEVFHHGLPDASAAQAFLHDLLGDKKVAEAGRTWAWILSKNHADDKIAIEYVNSLLETRSYDAAAHAWADYQGAHADGYVFNGDFEADPGRGPFDWRLDKRPGFKISIDPGVAYSGHRSARIQFDGTENVETIDLSQTIFLPPGRYKFQAYVKMDGITTDQGVSFQVLNVTTDNMMGTTDWRLVEKEFQVPANAGLVQVRLFRRRSWKADDLIKGTVWIDQVRIVREERK